MISLEKLQYCVDNNESLFNIIKGKTNKLIVEKYQFTPHFDIRVINLSGTKVIDWYHNLSAFDTHNMIQELLSPINN